MGSNAISSRMGLIQWSMLLLLSILWGGSYFFVEIALLEWSPLLIVAVRVAIATVVIWGIVLAAGLPLPKMHRAGSGTSAAANFGREREPPGRAASRSTSSGVKPGRFPTDFSPKEAQP